MATSPVRNYEYTKGLPQQSPHWTHRHRMPGDPTAETDAHDILARYELAKTKIQAFDSVEVEDTVTQADISDVFPDASTENTSSIEWLKMVTNKRCFPDISGDREFHDPVEHWQYSHKRQAQEILPFLWLGPANMAKDEAFLTEAGITMVVAVKDGTLIPAKLLEPRTAERLGLETAKISFTADRVIAKFPDAIAIVNKHLKERWNLQQRANNQRAQTREMLDTSLPARVLIYDITGNESAALVVGAYLVAAYGTKPWEATFVVHSKRFCINAQHLQAYMLRWHAIVDAKKQIRAANTPVPGALSVGSAIIRQSRKRSLETDSDDENIATSGMTRLLVADDMMTAHQRHRRIAAPFADTEDDDDDEEDELQEEEDREMV